MERDPAKLAAATALEAAALRKLVADTDPALWDSASDGDWTARQILTHLADVEIAYGFRLRVALAENGNPITAFDHDRWAATLPYGDVPVAALADLYTSARRVNIALLTNAPESHWQNTIEHPVNGPVTVERLASIFVPHGSEHITQLQGMLAG